MTATVPDLPLRTTQPAGHAKRRATAPAGSPERTGEVEFRSHHSATVLADLATWHGLYLGVYADDRHRADHTDPPLAARLASHAGRPGFELVAAHAEGRPVGFVYGYRLTPDTQWWRGLTPPPDPALVAEWPGRTVALCEGLMLPAWRGRGLSSELLARLLAGRTEERGAALVAHGNMRMLDMARARGWTRVGDLEPHHGWRPHAAFVFPLRPVAPAAGSTA